MACRFLIACIHAWTLAALAAPTWNGAQPSAGTGHRPPGRAAYIRLVGDLDAMAAIEDISILLDEAHAQRAPLLVLEVGANRARPDVLLALADAVIAAEIPTVAFVTDRADGRATPPAVALALLVGDRVAIDPATELRFERGDWRADLLPEGTPGDDSLEQLRSALQRALAGREIDPTLAAMFLPDIGSGPGDALDASALPNVGIDVLVADSLAKVLRACGQRGSPPRATEIAASTEPARLEVEGLIASADRAIEETRRGLDLRNQRPDDREVSVHAERRAGKEGLDRLTAAMASVDRAEAVLREFPELLLAPPPGRTDVGTTRTSLRSAWRFRLDDLRGDIEYWRQRANDLASR